ncbi:hypothetical protein Sjap_023965 [Stephania japonica]|uniref:Uncharacterized protein n=1 Tax=Stephania japonica TaxID=461633 RepID=A0AAP0EJX2_9MAGN
MDVCRTMHRSTPVAMPSSFPLHLQARTFSGDKHSLASKAGVGLAVGGVRVSW